MIRCGFVSCNKDTIAALSHRSYAALRGITIWVQPRACSFSTTCVPRNPAPPVTTARLFVQKFMPLLQGCLLPDTLCSLLQGGADRISPTVPVTELLLHDLFSCAWGFYPGHFQVRIDHDTCQLLERH